MRGSPQDNEDVLKDMLKALKQDGRTQETQPLAALDVFRACGSCQELEEQKARQVYKLPSWEKSRTRLLQ